MKLGYPGIFGRTFAAAAISFGAGVMVFSPLRLSILPAISLIASALWLIFVVSAFRRCRWHAAWTLLGAPFALISPLVILLAGLWCDWGRNACI